MDKDLVDELLDSVKQMDRIAAGERSASRTFVFEEPDVKAIREKTRLSQRSFAALIGVSKRTLENWEQGRRHPTGPAKTLLRLVDRDPEHALKTLHAS